MRNILAYAEEYQVECVKVHVDKLLATYVYADLNVEVAKLDYYGGGEETMKQVTNLFISVPSGVTIRGV